MPIQEKNVEGGINDIPLDKSVKEFKFGLLFFISIDAGRKKSTKFNTSVSVFSSKPGMRNREFEFTRSKKNLTDGMGAAGSTGLFFKSELGNDGKGVMLQHKTSSLKT
jgi:hypothetical protein